jgi:hypothetical protein
MWNVDVPSKDELVALASERSAGSVSIYLESSPVTPDAEAHRIDFKNLASEAAELLSVVSGVSQSEISEIGDELDDLLDDDKFWAHQARGLAVFVTPEHMTIYRTPVAFESRVHVSDRFFLKPLLSVASEAHTCYVLALAEGGVRLIEVPADLPPSVIRLPDLPTSAADAAGKASINDRSHSGRLVGSEGKRTHIRHYAREVDAALRPYLSGSDTPLVLSAVEPIRSIFRGVNTYPHLVAEAIETSPDRSTDQELAAAAREVLATVMDQQMEELRQTIEVRSGQGRVTTDVAQASRAATAGAIDTLVMDRDYVLPGTVDDDGSIEFGSPASTSTYGIIDEVARRVLQSGGRVLSVDAARVPGDQPIVAILRYPF